LTLTPELEQLKTKYFNSHPDDPVIFHRKEIMNKKYPFKALADPKIEKSFNSDLLELLVNWKYKTIVFIIIIISFVLLSLTFRSPILLATSMTNIHILQNQVHRRIFQMRKKLRQKFLQELKADRIRRTMIQISPRRKRLNEAGHDRVKEGISTTNLEAVHTVLGKIVRVLNVKEVVVIIDTVIIKGKSDLKVGQDLDKDTADIKTGDVQDQEIVVGNHGRGATLVIVEIEGLQL